MDGQILGNRYKLIREIGSGGMAWVYLAQDLREDRQVAVKILYPQLGQDVGFLRRFSQEAKLAMSLARSSPEMHVVAVLDYGSDRDTHYLVMEHVPGEDLRQVLDREGALLWLEALDIARQVALALGHAHQHGIVHRDIKPENIMLLPDGTARVLDFGIARARTSPTLTHSGFVGSPHYAAPEQVMGRAVDVRADLYALGIVLYEMLAGRRPFKSDTPWAVIDHHIASPPPSLDKARPDLPGPVVRLARKAMSKRPEDRFQTPAEMVQVIEAVLAGQDLPLASPGVEPEIPASLLAGLYQRGQQAIEEEVWQEAVDAFSQVLRLDPRYRDIVEQLAKAGQQARLAALYAAAQRALQAGQPAEALAQLDEIVAMAPDYRDVQGLLAAARAQLERERRRAQTEPERQPARPRRRRLLWAIVAILVMALAVEAYVFYRAQQSPAVAWGSTPTPAATRRVAQSSTPTLPDSTAPAATVTITQQPATGTSTPRPSDTMPPARATRSPATTATDTVTPRTLVTATPTHRAPAEPRLSGQIAFPRFDPQRGTYDVYACHVDGTACTRLAAEASQPDFLPGGARLVVHSWRPDEKGLLLQTLWGQRLWEITDSLEAARPSVDAQGSSYVYHSRQESDRIPRLYRTYGTETRPLLLDGGGIPGVSPAWTPDGRILYSGCWQDACGILVMAGDGTQPRQVVAGSTETNPEASPAPLEGSTGGQQIAFMSQRDGNWEIYVVNIDGSGLRRLTHHPANDGLPTWSPAGGRHLAFVSDRSGQWAVWAMRPDGSDLEYLFDLGGALDGRVQVAAPHETHGWVEERISWAPLPPQIAR